MTVYLLDMIHSKVSNQNEGRYIETKILQRFQKSIRKCKNPKKLYVWKTYKGKLGHVKNFDSNMS